MFERISCDPGILGGKPCIKGTRISVEFILELVESGGSIATIVGKYPHLEPKDVEQAVQYAAHFLENEILLSPGTSR